MVRGGGRWGRGVGSRGGGRGRSFCGLEGGDVVGWSRWFGVV